MNSTIDELSVEMFEDGEQVVKQLKKSVLSRGAWTTILFLYQDKDRKTKEFLPPKARIVRYKKWKGQFRAQSKFNISNAKQAKDIIKVLQEWFAGDNDVHDKDETSFEEADE